MKTKNKINALISSLALMTLSLFGGCATSEKAPPKEEAHEPVQSTKAASFDVIRPRKIAVLSANTERRSIFRSSIYTDLETPIHMMLEDFFTDSLLSKGYTVASRSDVAALLKEIGFQNSGLTEANAAKLGRMLNVSSVLIVRSINHNEEICTWTPQREEFSVTVGARLVSVETAEVIWIGSYTHRKTIIRPAYYQDVLAYGGVIQNLFREAGRKLEPTFPDFK